MRSFHVATLALAAVAALAQKPDCSLVPGWKQQGPPREYNAENLFEYMDGNAEGYLIYRFVGMKGVNCVAGEDTLIFDVSEMEDAESAFGLFSSNRDPRLPAEKIGMGGQLNPRRVVFAKDKYYIEIGASKDAPDILRTFALAMEKTFAGRTDPPAQLGWFPADQIRKDEVRLIPESVLGVRALKRGYVAKYEHGGQAFIVTEASPESAAKVMQALRTRVGDSAPATIADEAIQANNQYLGRLCFFRKGRYVAGFSNVPEGKDAVALSTALAARIP